MGTTCLGLTTNYCPKWGTREAFREIKSNCLDACGDAHFVRYFKSVGASGVEFHTSTSPTMSDMTLLGAGKSDGINTIGTFHEGLKVSALAILRLGGTFKVRTPELTGEYYLVTNDEGYSVLHFKWRGFVGQRTGCLVTITAPDSSFSTPLGFEEYSNLFLDNREPRLLPHKDNKVGPTLIYCKGVMVCKLTDASPFDFNLDLRLNRDRSIPDTYYLRDQSGRLLSEAAVRGDITFDYLLRPIPGSPTADTWESPEHDLISLSYGWTSGALKPFAESFTRVYGENARIASAKPSRNDAAIAAGLIPITLDPHLASLALNCPTVDSLFAPESLPLTDPPAHATLVFSCLTRFLHAVSESAPPLPPIHYHSSDEPIGAFRNGALILPAKADAETCLAIALAMLSTSAVAGSSTTAALTTLARFTSLSLLNTHKD